MATSLPTNIDASYGDDPNDPSVVTHQQHHDAIHAYTNSHDGASDPHGDRAYTDAHKNAVGAAAHGGLAIVSATAPASPATDQLWYDTANALLKRWTGTAWEAEGNAAYVAAGAGATASVSTFESTTSTTPIDLTTAGPAPSVTVGASGKLLVVVQAWIRNSTVGAQAYMGFTLSGANTLAAHLDRVAAWDQDSADYLNLPGVFLLTGLAAGSTTVTAKYWVEAGTGTFGRRIVTAIPL